MFEKETARSNLHFNSFMITLIEGLKLHAVVTRSIRVLIKREIGELNYFCIHFEIKSKNILIANVVRKK